MLLSKSNSFQHQHVYPLRVLGDSYATRYIRFLGETADTDLQCMDGMGISGANILQFKRALKSANLASRPFCANILIFIGANNLLQSTQPKVFKKQVLSLVKLLVKIFPNSQLIFAELPVFPRVQQNPSLIRSIEAANTFLRSLRSDRTAVVSVPPQLTNSKYFHAFYGKSNKRDGIHLNHLGYKELTPCIVSVIRQWHATHH